MKKQIVIIGNEPLTQRLNETFYIDTFIKAGYRLLYWDFSAYFYPGITLADSLEKPFISKHSTVGDLKTLLEACDIAHTLFIIDRWQDRWATRHFFQTLVWYHCSLIHIDVYANATLRISKKRRLQRLFISGNGFFNKLKAAWEQKVYRNYQKKCGYKVDYRIFTSAQVQPHTDMINHPDYEQWRKLNQQEETSVTEKPYIVFLDIFFPLHPDLHHIFGVEPLSAPKYYQRMNRFFDYIEQKFNMPVIIAAHPKSTYQNREWNGRKSFKYKTGELVQNSSMVVSHLSNSTSYSILWNKPIVFITTDDMRKIPKFNFKITCLAEACGRKSYNIDRCHFDKINFSPLTKAQRDGYVYNYLTSSLTEHLTNSQILVRAFDQHFANIEQDETR